MALVIKEADIRSLITPDEARGAVREAHRDLAGGVAHNVPRARARSTAMGLHQLSAASNRLGFAASKIYSATKDTVRSLILLFDNGSGELVAVIEANELGRIRTAAASVLAATTICKSPAPIVAIIGAGFQAEGIVEALAAVRTSLLLEKIQVYSRSSDNLAEFVLVTSTEHNIVVVESPSGQEAVRDAAIVFTTTTSSRPVLELGWMEQVSCICSLGANSLARSELDPRIVSAARRVIVDARDVAALEGGSLLSPLENGKLLWNQVSELGELLVSQRPERIVNQKGSFDLFCSHGLAVQDLYVAHHVYSQAQKRQADFTSMSLCAN